MLEGWAQGGTEAYVSSLAHWLRRNAPVELGLCLLNPGKFQKGAKLPGWASQTWRFGEDRGQGWASLRRAIRSFRPDVVHTHLYSSLLPAALVARSAGSARVVTTLHMPLYPWHWRYRLAWRAAIRASHAIVGVSHDVLASIGAREDRDRFWVVPSPLAADLRSATVMSPRTGADRAFTVCGVGRLSREKDWPTLIEAFAAFRARAGGASRLVIYGEGEERPALHALVRRLGIGSAVDLPGALNRIELPGRLAEADVFVLPSRFEGFGIAAIEAMALGIPTIAADYGASLDYIEHGVTGHRFPVGNVQVLAEVLAWHRREREASRIMGERGREFVRKAFSEENTLAQYPSIYGVRHRLPVLLEGVRQSGQIDEAGS
jgi:glycosyltransferase involved in cell wall biosynthesis